MKRVIFALLVIVICSQAQAKYSGGSDLTGDEWVDLDDLTIFCDNWLDAQ